MIQRLQYFPQEDIKNWVNASTEYASSLCKIRTPANIQRIAIILLTIFHFYEQDNNILKSFFELIMKTDDYETAHLSAYCIAKISAEKLETDSSLASIYLSYGMNLLTVDNKKGNLIIALHMIKEYSSLLPTFFILNSGEIQVTLWNLLFSSNNEIQNLDAEVLTQYFITLIKTKAYNLREQFNEYMQLCLNHIHDFKVNSSPAVASIMAELLRLKPHYFELALYDIYYTITPHIEQAKGKFKQKCVMIRALLSAVDPPIFHVEFFTDVFNSMIKMIERGESVPTVCEMFCVLLDFLPDPIIQNISIILAECIKIVQGRDIQNIKSVLSLLKKILTIDSSLNVSKSVEIWQLVSGVLFTPNFLDLFPLLQTGNSTFWEDHSNVIIEKVLLALNVLSDYSIHALKLIPMLPMLNNPELVPQVKKYLFAKNDDLRAAAPRALLHILPSDDPVEFSKVLKQLIAIAASDTSLTVRISIISSFNHLHYPYLAHDPFLKFLKNLANDNSPQVRSFCFQVLKNTRKYSPIGSDSILRNALINALYALQCSASSFERAHATESLPALIEASATLFPIYATTMIPIIIKLLSIRGTTNSVIGSEAETQLTINLIKTIQGILQVNHQSISPYLTQILPIFTTLLKEYSSKEIKKLVIDTLSLFVKKTASTANIYGVAPMLLDALLSIAAHSESKSLKVRALEFIGQCGAVSPQRVPSEQSGASRADDTIQLNNGEQAQNEYYGSLIFPKLMEMVNDKYLSNFRTQSLSTAITTLSMMSTQSSEHLSQIIPIILTHIQESTDTARIESIKQLKTLTLVAKQQMFPHVESILNCIYEQWDVPDLNYFIDVISSIVVGLGNDFLPFLYPLVSRIRRTISSSISTNTFLADSCLKLSATLCSYFPSLCKLFIPQICNTISMVYMANNIKVTALKTLKSLIQKTDPNPYAGVIFSAVSLLCVDKESYVQNIALGVLKIMIFIIDKNINYYAHRIFDVLQKDERAAKEFDRIMNLVRQNTKSEVEYLQMPSSDSVRSSRSNSSISSSSSKQMFMKCFDDDAMYTPKHWQNWYQHLISTAIVTSPCSTISCCSQLSAAHKRLAIYLFPAAFSTCWSELTTSEKSMLSKKLSISLQNPKMPNNLLKTLVSLIEQLERVGNGLQFDPKDFINICIRSRSISFGLHHLHEYYMRDKNEITLRQFAIFLSEVSHQMDMSPLIKMMNKPISKEFLLTLKMWDEAFPLYQKKMDSGEKLTPNELIGYIFCAQNLYKYNDIINMSSLVLNNYKECMPKISQSFAQSTFFTDKSILAFYSSFETEPTIKNLTTKAFSLITLGKYDDAKIIIKQVFEMIATKHSLNFKSPYPVIYPLVVTCQYLYELTEIIETKGNIPRDMWKQRLQNAEPTSLVWMNLISPRMIMMNDDQAQFNKFLEITINEKKYSMFEAFFKHFYPNFDLENSISDHVPANIYLHYLWSKNQRDEVLDRLELLLTDPNRKPVHFTQIMMYVEYVLNDALFDYELLQSLEVLLREILPLRKINITQKWAVVNYYLFRNNPAQKTYAIEAIKSYSNVLQQQPFVAISDICAAVSLFFLTSGDPEIFNSSLAFMNAIPIQKMAEVIPQLIAFLYSPIPAAQQIATSFLVEIYRSQPHNVLTYAHAINDNQQHMNNTCFASLFNLFAVENPILFTEAGLFKNMISLSSMTIFEQWLQTSRELINSLLTDDNRAKSNLDHLFYKLNEVHIKEIVMTMTSKDPKFENPQMRASLVNKAAQQIVSNCQDFVRRLEKVRLSDVMDSSPSFENSQLLIPGMSKPMQTIKNELQVIPVKTRPRQITFIGKDGNEYIFLIRVHEGATFHVRAAQFNTLVKLFLRRTLGNSAGFPYTISTFTPIANNITLLQHSHELMFLEQVIAKFRQTSGSENTIEVRDMAAESIQRVDLLRPIQRLEILNTIPKHYDDLRKAFWAMSSSSDQWLEQGTAFANSYSFCCSLGSLAWMGGRCPSNILVNVKSGEISMIDYSLIFKAGFNNLQNPDEVPFRLTPMITHALGIGGVEMLFKPYFKRIQHILTDFAYLILPTFYLLAEEPFVPYQSQPNAELRKKILDDVFDVLYEKTSDIDSYIQNLIDAATNEYNLAKQHSTWRPFW